MTAPKLSPAELVAAIRDRLTYTPNPVYVPSSHERDYEPAGELEDDAREHDMNFPRHLPRY